MSDYNIHTIIEFMKCYAKNNKEYCMYINAYNKDGSQVNQYEFSRLLGKVGIKSFKQIIYDGCFIITFDSLEDMNGLYDHINTEDKLMDKCRIYMLTCGNDGEFLRENV